MASRKVLFIGLVWPEPTSSAAGTRIVQLVNLFLANGNEVHFASAALKGEFSFDLVSIGVINHDIKLNDSSFNHWIAVLNPAVVVFDRFMVEEQYGWRVQQECPNAVLILDTEDLHFLRHA
ncbi:MAG: glycosyltransferase, partial [Pedobacter sp.]